jgi:hypothetical protein
MGEAEVNGFLCHLAVREKVAASTQRQALSAILFLYSNVLDQPLPYLDKLIRAKQPNYSEANQCRWTRPPQQSKPPRFV